MRRRVLLLWTAPVVLLVLGALVLQRASAPTPSAASSSPSCPALTAPVAVDVTELEAGYRAGSFEATAHLDPVPGASDVDATFELDGGRVGRWTVSVQRYRRAVHTEVSRVPAPTPGGCGLSITDSAVDCEVRDGELDTARGVVVARVPARCLGGRRAWQVGVTVLGTLSDSREFAARSDAPVTTRLGVRD